MDGTWELRFTMAVKAQGDVAQLAQVLFSDLADGGHRVALFAKLQLCPRLQRASKLAVVVNKAVLFDIRRGAPSRKVISICSSSAIVAQAPMCVMVVW